MNTSKHASLAARYRVMTRRFDDLWDRSSPDVDAEMVALLAALRQIEECLEAGDGIAGLSRTCATPATSSCPPADALRQ